MSFLSNLTIQNALPAGVIFPFAGSVAPDGWLLCDGTSYLRARYSRLFSAIETTHGSNAENTFNVPDYRGRFLRGTDNMGSGAAGRDPDNAARTAANANGNTGNNVGSVQNEMYSSHNHGGGSHSHTVNAHSHGGGNHSHGVNYTTSAGETGSGAIVSGTVDNTQGISLSIANSGNVIGSESPGTSAPSVTVIASNGGNETRPLNAYVNYIIKI